MAKKRKGGKRKMATTTVEAEQAQIIGAISNSIALVFDAIAACRKALLLNPSEEEERLLLRRIAALELQLANLNEDMAAHIARSRTWSGPSDEQMQEIGALMNLAATLTTAALTQEGVVNFATRVLAVATDIADKA